MLSWLRILHWIDCKRAAAAPAVREDQARGDDAGDHTLHGYGGCFLL